MAIPANLKMWEIWFFWTLRIRRWKRLPPCSYYFSALRYWTNKPQVLRPVTRPLIPNFCIKVTGRWWKHGKVDIRAKQVVCVKNNQHLSPVFLPGSLYIRLRGSTRELKVIAITHYQVYMNLKCDPTQCIALCDPACLSPTRYQKSSYYNV